MANKQIIFLKNVKTLYGDVAKGEILTGIEYNKVSAPSSPEARPVAIPGFLFNFYEKKDPSKFLDKSVEETFFIPTTSFGDKGTIREVKPEDLKKPVINVDLTMPAQTNTPTEPTNNSNKIVSFVLGALVGIIAGYIVLNKLKK